MSGSEPAVRPPKQERSRRSLKRMLDATEELLAEHSFDEIPVSKIARRAGYTKGAFYYRFEDKQALLHHLHGRTFDEALEGWEEFLSPAAWNGCSLSEVAAGFVRRLVRIYSERRALMRAFIYQARWNDDEPVKDRLRELNEFVRDRLLILVRDRRSQLAARHRDQLEEAVDFWLAACMGVLGQLLLFGREYDPAFDCDATSVEHAAINLLVPFLVDSA